MRIRFETRFPTDQPRGSRQAYFRQPPTKRNGHQPDVGSLIEGGRQADDPPRRWGSPVNQFRETSVPINEPQPATPQFRSCGDDHASRWSRPEGHSGTGASYGESVVVSRRVLLDAQSGRPLRRSWGRRRRDRNMRYPTRNQESDGNLHRRCSVTLDQDEARFMC